MASGLVSVSNAIAARDTLPARTSVTKPPRQFSDAQSPPERPIKLQPQSRSRSQALTTYTATAGVDSAPRYGGIDEHA